MDHAVRPCKLVLLATILFGALSMGGALGGAEGDPPLNVPTLQQGRALLTRDMLHQQCLKAMLAKDWQQLSHLAEQALQEEKNAFGSGFSGSGDTRVYRDAANRGLGKETESVRELRQGYFNANTEFRVQFGEEALSTVKEATAANENLKQTAQVLNLTSEVLADLANASATGDFTDLDAKIPALYESAKQRIERLRSQKVTLEQAIKSAEFASETEGDETSVRVDYQQWIETEEFVLGRIAMLYSEAEQRAGKAGAALDLARRAISLTQRSEPFWDLDSTPGVGGRAIGLHYLSLLDTRLAEQRRNGDWTSAVKTADEMLPIAMKVWDNQRHLELLRVEAEELSKKPRDVQERYAETVSRQVDFEAAMGERRFRDAIELGVKIVDERTSILGTDCVEAAKINRKLGYLYWTQGDYSSAFARLAKTALVFAKKLPSDDDWLKAAISDLYVNATLLAQSESNSSDVAKRLETVVDSLSETLPEKHFAVAEGRLCLLGMHRLLTLSNEERNRYSVLSAAAVNRDHLWSIGRFAEAVQVGEPLADQAKQLFGEPSPQHLVHLRSYANCLAKSGIGDASLAVYRDLLKLYDTAPFNRTSDFHWTYHGMANALSTLGGRENNMEALQWLAKARNSAAESLGNRTNEYASHLRLEAQILRDSLDAPAKALQKYQEASAIFISTHGNQESFDYCQGLVNVGLCQNELRLWAAAEKHLKLALEIRERNNYQNPYMLAWNLWALGSNAFDQRKYSDAISYFSRALVIKEQEMPNANDISSLYGQLLAASTLSDTSGDETRKLLRQFFDRRRLVHVDDPTRFADECRDAAQWLFDDPGELLNGMMTEERQAILDELVAAGRRAYLDAGTADDRKILQLQYYSAFAAALSGDSERAFPAFEALLEQARSLDDPPHSLIGNSHGSLSNLYKKEFAFDQALHHGRLKREACEHAHGENSIHVADALKGEADILLALGDYSLAEQLTQRAADIFSELGHPMQAEIYQQLSLIHQRRRDFDRAEQYLYAARAHLTELGSHQDLELRNRLALSRLMLARGDYSRALETATQLVDSASDSPHVLIHLSARSIRAIALLGLGQSHKALEAMKEIITETEQNPTLRIADATRIAYASACQKTGDQQEASKQFRMLIGDLTEQHNTFGSVLSERQKLELRSKLHQALSVYVSNVVETEQSLVDCYRTIMPLKGLVSTGLRQRARAKVASSQKTLNLSRQIDNINRELSALLFGTAVSGQKQSVERIGQLTKQRESLEVKLSVARKKNGGPAVDITSSVSLDQLQRSLMENESLIDFVSYIHHDQPGLPHSETEDRYLAFVVRRDTVHVVQLGPADELKPLVKSWRATLQRGTEQEFAEANQSLCDRVWRRLDDKLGNSTAVLLSLDGMLSKVSFAAFPTNDGKYLIDERVLIAISAPRSLIQTRARQKEQDGPAVDADHEKTLLLLGGVDYLSGPVMSASPETPSNRSKTPLNVKAFKTMGTASRGTALRSASSVASWSYLPGTKEEIQQVELLAKKFDVASSIRKLDGANSSEAAVAKLSDGTKWMHLATHGFFAESNADADAGSWEFQSLSRQAVVGFDPRLLTGIVLSGANQPAKAGLDDGILTAAEIERLNLSDTELVVLSACETALGEGRSGEGVMGLQRSLHRAGAKNVIASLWKVDDQATMVLMTRFYENLWEKKKTPAESLREAQLWMLNHPKQVFTDGVARTDRAGLNFGRPAKRPSTNKTTRLPPKYWAAFTISGDWR